MEWLKIILATLGKVFSFRIKTRGPSSELLDRYQAEYNRLEVWYGNTIEDIRKRHSQDVAAILIEMARQKRALRSCQRDRARGRVERRKMSSEISRLQQRVVLLEGKNLHGTIRANTRGIIVEANDAMATLAGVPLGELIGSPVINLIPMRYRERHTVHFGEVVAGRAVRVAPLDAFLLNSETGHEEPVTIELNEWTDTTVTPPERFIGADVKRR